MAKIPEEAKKIFEGVLFDVYQWEQKMYDGNYKTFEMIERKPTVGVIGLVGNKIIVLIQEQPTKPLFPSLAGGAIEKGEDALVAAKRELLEETGYESSEFELLGEFCGSSKIFFQEYSFVARNCQKVSEQSLDSGEKIEVRFYSYEDFLQLCRDKTFTAPLGFKFMMYEALLDENKNAEFKKQIFGK